MYQYDDVDRRLVSERIEQFRGQLRRFLRGELSEPQFRQLRLRNGLYLERHAHMLRVAVPYGTLSSVQMRALAAVARDFDRGYGHFTTRQNIQFNWPKLEDVPEVLARLAEVELSTIETSGNVVRNITTDHLAGVAADELEDPRAYCELLRQWSTLHPELQWLPRKFKIAVTGGASDRAATRLHDIGLRLVRAKGGEIGFEVLVGGGQGRTPYLAKVLRDFLPKVDLLSYCEAVLRVYNLLGRRGNIHKARIKILVNAVGIEVFRSLVDEEWARIKDGPLKLDAEVIGAMQAFFAPPAYEHADHGAAQLGQWQAADAQFASWLAHNTSDHRVPGYRVVTVSLKSPGVAPGDIADWQMDGVADLADKYSFGTVRSSHQQNLLLTDVRERDLFRLWWSLRRLRLATPNIGTLGDMICCPGLDYCSLANASAISVAAEVNARFQSLDTLYDLGEIRLNISGCVNACGHHHVGHIGVLGVEKNGEEWYQLSLGGSAGDDAALGERLGPAVGKSRVADVVASIIEVYVSHRRDGERFIDTYRRIGIQPFKESVHADHPRQPHRPRSLAA